MELSIPARAFFTPTHKREIVAMSLLGRRAPVGSLGFFIVSLLTTTLAGCGGGSGGIRQDELDQASKGYKQSPVAKFAGQVSIDNQPPGANGVLFVVLNDPQHLERPGDVPKLFTECDAEGKFAFTSYLKGDGAPLGKYVVTFVHLRQGGSHEGAGPRGLSGRGPDTTTYSSQDGLKNLYNDPEKNKNEPNFQIEVASPGRTDYDFNLTVAGKDPVLKPGMYAVTRVTR
jgi:hypothetical protein